ncbi:MAG TPA: addiction module antidote protein, HigA family [Alphaproteobacteria bacterium]|nr:addiction module antidote protein, HigA family [Alphaproteobacteria bacterium]HAJ47099.1 addiction module antidote protein, HigA family [Alphaproteobacteria bacterium]
MTDLKAPAHSGDFVKHEIIEAYGLTVTAGAKVLGVTRQALSEFLNCRTSLSAEMALRLEKAFGVDMPTLMRMQTAYDIAAARKRAASIDMRLYRGRVAAGRETRLTQ